MKKAQKLSEENGLSVAINQAYIDNVGEEYAEAEDVVEAYEGFWNSDIEFVQNLVDDIGDLPELPAYIHIDWESTARDIMMDYFEIDGYYFRNL